MRRICVLVCLAFIATALAADVPPNVVAPHVPGIFRIDPPTGALTPLEKVTSVMEGGRVRYTFYLPGQASPIVAFSDEPQQFIQLRFGDIDVAKELQDPSVVIERLDVQPKGRYATKQFIAVDASVFGDVVNGADPTGMNRPARAFVYTARTPLPPGEYAISYRGLITPWVYGGSASATNASAFRVIARPQAASGSSQPSFGQLELIVPYGTGGAVDQVARTFAEGFTETSMFRVVVTNRPGEGALLGKSALMNAKPNGLVLGILALNESDASLARGLTPIAMLIRGDGDRIRANYGQALVGPPGMDPKIVKQINRDALAALAMVRDKLRAMGLTVVGSSDRDFAAFVDSGGGRFPEALKP